ncbi:hypothetical protein FRC17_001612 [Serendipita sp. 399]|nr:hypothetical protein FRC17_001612 [Serendipita sp. 399]
MRFQAVFSVLLIAVTAVFAAPIPQDIPSAVGDDGVEGSVANAPWGSAGGGWKKL